MREDILIDIARKAIAEKLYGKKMLDREGLIERYPELKEKRAVFVTLNKRKELRGCIGSIIAHRALVDDIVENARAAAFGDPRFVPLRPDEYENIEIEISILTPPQELVYTDIDDLRKKIRKGVDGVILNVNGRQATYLPSVWEQLPDFDIFFSTLCQKAGLPGSCLQMHPVIYVYQAQKIHE